MTVRGGRRLLVVVLGSMTMGLTPMGLTPLAAQTVSSLDAWLVSRFRGAQLLADSTPATASVAAESPLPRIEGTRAGRATDTLYAIHFGTRLGTPALSVNTVVQLTGPTGTITPLTARVVARRAFRAPRRPGTPSSVSAAWRYGWSYQVVMPRGAKANGESAAPASRYRGWLLLASNR